MLAALSLMGGKAIGKYIAIGLAAVALVSFIYIGWASYNKAITKAATEATKNKTLTANLEVERGNTKKAVQILQSERKNSRREINRLQHLSRLRQKRASETSRTLAAIFNSNGSDAVAKFEQLLNVQLARANGESFNDNAKRDAGNSGAPSAGTVTLPFACFGKETARKMIHNATAIADFADDVEALKVSNEQPRKPLSKGNVGE